MNRFNRDFALVDRITGNVWAESHSRDRLATLQSELNAEGYVTEIVSSDLPRSAGATRKQ